MVAYGILGVIVVCLSLTQQQASPPAASSSSAATPVALVDGVPVSAGEVRREVERVIAGRKIGDDAKKLLHEQAIKQLIDQRLVLAYLKKQKLAASKADVQLALERLRRQLKARDLTLEEYLKLSGRSEDSLRRRLAWRASWRRYLDRYITEENLRKYYQKHRRHFDGTKIRVAHILLKVEPKSDPASASNAIAQAKEVRSKIQRGELTFEQAARRFSTAPTGKQGGDLGMISRHEPMPEVFSRTAFDLKAGEISHPLVSAFGVHLILCHEIEPGQKTWTDVRPELEQKVAEFLFRWVADRQRPHSKIEYPLKKP